MIRLVALLFSLLALNACKERTKDGKVVNTPTAGTVKIGVVESLAPLLDAEIMAFEATYVNAKINVLFGSEEDIMKAFREDSVKLVFISRPLVQHEEEILEEQRISPQTLIMASEGVAIITHKENTENNLHINDLRSILNGNATSWKDVFPTDNRQDDLVVVFNQPNSSIVQFLRDSVGGFTTLPENCFGLSGDTAVIEYVSKNKSALGLIGASWISDRDDATTNRFLESIHVMAIKKDSAYYQPYQAYIANREYPLIRNVYMISREARAGLASGFMAYIASDKGQRIVLKLGLVPQTMPVRVVEFVQETE